MRQRIEVNPLVMVGKPVIRGTRIPVDTILLRLAEGMTMEDVLEDLPRLKKEDISAALAYSAEVVRGEDVLPVLKGKGKHAASG